jgi:hypothetical protein
MRWKRNWIFIHIVMRTRFSTSWISKIELQVWLSPNTNYMKTERKKSKLQTFYYFSSWSSDPSNLQNKQANQNLFERLKCRIYQRQILYYRIQIQVTEPVMDSTFEVEANQDYRNELSKWPKPQGSITRTSEPN